MKMYKYQWKELFSHYKAPQGLTDLSKLDLDYNLAKKLIMMQNAIKKIGLPGFYWSMQEDWKKDWLMIRYEAYRYLLKEAGYLDISEPIIEEKIGYINNKKVKDESI